LKINFLNYVFLGGVSLAMLMFALVSEYVFGYQPCTLCIQQRYPHVLIVALCLIIFIWKKKISTIYALNILLIFISVILAFYHVGVENNIFLGPESCSPYDLSNNSEKSPEALLNEILSKPMISCNAVSWSFLNLSMASWNLILSIILLFCWTFSLRQLIKPYSSNSTSQ
jgi:disulfide bond formation protein DsbB